MFERLTDGARITMALANQAAQRFNHTYIGTEHILLGLVQHGKGAGAQILQAHSIDLKRVRLEIERLVKQGDQAHAIGRLPQTPRSKKVIEYAIEEARNLSHTHVGTEHLLLGLLRESQGVGWQVLTLCGLTLERARDTAIQVASSEGLEDDHTSAELIGRLPDRLHVVTLGDPNLAFLSSEDQLPVTSPMWRPLAEEIAKRYNR